ncbi:MAG TPA: methyltransferase [Jiangellaceae bacterium]|nr:methyltransferase [Jiangellaceae bacterium]
MEHPRLTSDGIARLRDALAKAEYTVESVTGLLGPVASAALNRNETTPGRRATSGGSPLETLTRLWPLQLPVSRAAAESVLPLADLVDGGLLTAVADTVRAVVDVRPYADDAGNWWVVSDLTPGLDGRIEPVSADHVLGVNAASSTLAQITVRRPVGRALDLGTGCGVQALHLSRHCDDVVATDVNRRALGFAAMTARLNGVDVDLRGGNLYEPVEGERFDLIATNPPFVVSPGGHHVYRDSGLPGDELSRRVVFDGAARLADGGMLQSLANWMHVTGQDWRDRVGAWVSGTGCDAWVIQREVQDPAAYVEIWLRDAGDLARPDYLNRYDSWLAWFEAQLVEGVGFGWIMLHASRTGEPSIRVEDWPHAVELPLGPAVAGYFDRVDGLRRSAADEDLLASLLQVADGVVQEQVGRPGAEDPAHVVLRQQRGLRRAVEVGTAEAALVGACDGSLPIGVLIDAVAAVLEVDQAALRADLLPRVRQFVAEGYLEGGSASL